MILGLGIDSVEIKRFSGWHRYSVRKLSHLFSAEEITYCLSVSAKSAERFAVRFAAKEALLKALSFTSGSHVGKIQSITKIARACYVTHDPTGTPQLIVDWKTLALPAQHVLVSLTHTRIMATAAVIAYNE